MRLYFRAKIFRFRSAEFRDKLVDHGALVRGVQDMWAILGGRQKKGLDYRAVSGALLAALVAAHASAQENYELELDLALRQSPQADAPVALHYPAGSTVLASTVLDASGWLLVTNQQGETLGYTMETDILASRGLTSAPMRDRSSSALGAFLTGATPSAPQPAPGQTPVGPTAEVAGPSRLGAFLSGPATPPSRAAGSLSFASLTDGQLKSAQASHEAEQRRLAAIRAAEWEAAEAARRAEEAAYRAEMEIREMEEAYEREEARMRQAEGDRVIANAMMTAALTVGQAAADSIVADYNRTQAESQRRIAEANRRAAERDLQRARANADQVRRDAQAEADRAQRESAAIAQRSATTASVDYLGQAQARRAAEAEFQRRQAAGAQSLASVLSSGGSTSSANPTSSSAPRSGTTNVGAFIIDFHSVGEGSGSRRISNLDVSVSVRRVNVNGEKSEICASLRNPMVTDWSGGYRLTNTSDNTTFATVQVASGATVSRCEILPVVRTYNVVLRQN